MSQLTLVLQAKLNYKVLFGDGVSPEKKKWRENASLHIAHDAKFPVIFFLGIFNMFKEWIYPLLGDRASLPSPQWWKIASLHVT
jgi:hypothetical protein